MAKVTVLTNTCRTTDLGAASACILNSKNIQKVIKSEESDSGEKLPEPDEANIFDYVTKKRK